MKMTADFDKAWQGFTPGSWQRTIEVRDFIQHNVTPYDGDESFLVGPTARTQGLNRKFQELLRQEAERGGGPGCQRQRHLVPVDVCAGVSGSRERAHCGASNRETALPGGQPFWGLAVGATGL